MIEKNNEYSPKSDSSRLLAEDKVEVSNFKLIYRNTSNPERGRSSGASSDEETTSSSLVPLPDTLKKMRNKSKWTMSEAREPSELNTAYDSKILGESPGNIMNSLEKLRQKYTLKNEASVTLKMNSANSLLDDILSSAHLNKTTSQCLQSKLFKEQDIKSKAVSENETSSTESVVSHSQPWAHTVDHSHIPLAVNFVSPPCHKHCNPLVQPLHDSHTLTEELFISKRDLQGSQKKKKLKEIFQDFQIKCKLQSVLKSWQKTKNHFAKNKKESQNVTVQQGIPGANYQEHATTGYEPPVCKCELGECPLKQYSKYSKKLILDLIESSEMSQPVSNSTEREKRRCTCMKHECNCPEIIPKSVCAEHPCKAFEAGLESPKQCSLYSECISEPVQSVQVSQPATPYSLRTKENESSSELPNEGEENRKKKTDSLSENHKGWKKHCSKEKKLIERTDIYYFDHGNSAYYQTTDNHPLRYTEYLVERTDEYATKFWAEFFGTIEIGVAFLISFILQLYRFLFTSIIRSLSIKLLQIFSDYFFKPLLTIIFNGIIQPCLILAYNMATSLRDLCLPISQIFGFFAKEVANVLRSCRLVDINHDITWAVCKTLLLFCFYLHNFLFYYSRIVKHGYRRHRTFT